MLMPLAYLPQHVAQVVGLAIGIAWVAFGVLVLVRGVPPGLAGGLNPRLLRILAVLVIPAGIAIAAAFFFIDAEGRNSREGDHWGGTYGIVMMLVFLVFLGGIAVYNLRKFREAERRAREEPTPQE